jgi:hypothetical protein
MRLLIASEDQWLADYHDDTCIVVAQLTRDSPAV